MTRPALLTHVLRHGDRALVLAQRLGQVIAHAPELEEDMAVANISLDLIGQARQLYAYAGELEGEGHEEDHFAYWRGVEEFLNPQLVEQPNGDFAVTIVRQFLHDVFALHHWEAMEASTDATLAALAARARKETAFHLRHSRGWVVRLGDGTDESHRRAQTAVDSLWRFTGELGPVADEAQLRADGVVPDGDVGGQWAETVRAALTEATLDIPTATDMVEGGWHGRHSEYLKPLIEELQALTRAHPGAQW